MKRITISLLAGCLGSEIDFENEPCKLKLFGLPGDKDEFDIMNKLEAKLGKKHSGCVKAGGSTNSNAIIVADGRVGATHKKVTCTKNGHPFAELEYPLPKWRPGALIWGNLYSDMEQDEDLICAKLFFRKYLIRNILNGLTVSSHLFELSGAYAVDANLRLKVHNEKKSDDRNSSPISVATDHESSLTGEIKVGKEVPGTKVNPDRDDEEVVHETGTHVPVSTLGKNDDSGNFVTQQLEEHPADDLVDSRIVDVSDKDAAPGVQRSPQVPSSEEIDHLDDSGVVSIDRMTDLAINNMVVPEELPVDDKAAVDLARRHETGLPDADNNMGVPEELRVDGSHIAAGHEKDISVAEEAIVLGGAEQHENGMHELAKEEQHDIDTGVSVEDAIGNHVAADIRKNVPAHGNGPQPLQRSKNGVGFNTKSHFSIIDQWVKNAAKIRFACVPEPPKTWWSRSSDVKKCDPVNPFTEFYHQLFGKDAVDPVANDVDIHLAAKEYYAQLEGERVVVHTGNAVDTYLNDGKGNVQIAKYQSVSDTEPDVKSLRELWKDMDFAPMDVNIYEERIKRLIVEKKFLGKTTFISCKLPGSIFDVHRFRPAVTEDRQLHATQECLGMINNNVQRFEQTTQKNADQGKFSWRDWRTWGK